MKTIIAAVLLFMAANGWAEKTITVEYRYRGKPITTEKFQILWEQYQDKLYQDSHGKVYDLYHPGNSNKLAEMPADPKVGDAGIIIAIVTMKNGNLLIAAAKNVQEVTKKIKIRDKRRNKIIYKDYIEATISNYKICLSAPEFAETIVNQCVKGPFAVTGTEKVGTEVYGKAERIAPITRDTFKNFLADNGTLWEWQKEMVPAGYEKCSICNGNGKLSAEDAAKLQNIRPLSNSSINYGTDKHTSDSIVCPQCEGNGKILIEAAKTVYVKKPLRQ